MGWGDLAKGVEFEKMRMLQIGFSASEAELVRGLQRNSTNRMCVHTHTHTHTHTKICFEKLAHTNTEAEKSHNLLFASWGPRTSRGYK